MKQRNPPRRFSNGIPPIWPRCPFGGGWGYNLATACIIEQPDDPEIPFDGVDVEYAFAAHRIYQELMFMRPVDDDGYPALFTQWYVFDSRTGGEIDTST